MKFNRKPSPIEANEFNGSNFPENIQFRQTGNEWEIYNKLHDSWIKIKIGDFYRTDIEGDNYPIDRQYMLDNFTESGTISLREKWFSKLTHHASKHEWYYDALSDFKEYNGIDDDDDSFLDNI